MIICPCVFSWGLKRTHRSRHVYRSIPSPSVRFHPMNFIAVFGPLFKRLFIKLSIESRWPTVILPPYMIQFLFVIIQDITQITLNNFRKRWRKIFQLFQIWVVLFTIFVELVIFLSANGLKFDTKMRINVLIISYNSIDLHIII